MFNFLNKKSNPSNTAGEIKDFQYLKPDVYYFDSACQTLRPEQVIQAQDEYFHEFNSCGHRVRYAWGIETDKKIEECRSNLLKLTGKSEKDYAVAFGLNTTSGINNILMQLPSKDFKSIITSDIEHNSVFLPSLVYSQKFSLPRKVLERDIDGSLIYELGDLEKAIVIVNTTSNIDGRELKNIDALAKDIHSKGGILLLDACQTLSHHPELIQNVDFDAVFGSGHKMYGPSVGFSIVKKELILKLDCFLIGGSTVQNVKYDSYELIEDESELYSRIEPGLQNYAGIVGLNEALKWRKNFKFDTSTIASHLEKNKFELSNLGFKPNQTINASEYEQLLSSYLNQKLEPVPNISLLNSKPSPIVSMYSTKPDLDGHKLAMYLSEAGVMCRSGYHCCHYYLKEKLNLPPLFRISLALHNNINQIDYLIDKLSFLTKN